MPNSEIAPELSHLDGDQLLELIEMYYDKAYTVAEIIKKYDIKTTAGKLVSLFPPQQDKDSPCMRCGAMMFRKWESRTSGNGSYFSKDSFCIECGHKEWHRGYYLCSCPACTEEREEERLRDEQAAKDRASADQARIDRAYGTERNYFPTTEDILDIDLRSAIYLLAMERQSVSSDVGLFSSLDDSEIGLSPDTKISIKILDHLLKEDLIRVDPRSPRNSFDIEENSVSHYYYRVNYFAHTGNNRREAKQNILKLEEIFKSREWPTHWRQDWKDTLKSIWMDISLYDCLNYLERLGKDRGFDTPRGDKTVTTILGALQEFSVATLYAFMWSAMVGASDYYQRSNVSKRQAANSVVGKIQNHADKVRIGEWELRKYHRFTGDVDSALYEVLFYLVLQIGEKGFTEPASACLSSIMWIDSIGDEC